jgi:hypothetical protein
MACIVAAADARTQAISYGVLPVRGLAGPGVLQWLLGIDDREALGLERAGESPSRPETRATAARAPGPQCARTNSASSRTQQRARVSRGALGATADTVVAGRTLSIAASCKPRSPSLRTWIPGRFNDFACRRRRRWRIGVVRDLRLS